MMSHHDNGGVPSVPNIGVEHVSVAKRRFDGVDVDIEEIQGVGPAAEDVGARLNPPRPVGEVERTKTSKV